MRSGTRPRPVLALATSSALALVLAMAPVTYDHDAGGFAFNVAHAKSCFAAGTMVRLADGTLRPIEAIAVGDLVLGAEGRANRVIGVERPRLAGRRLYALNAGRAFVTAEHPFASGTGWRAIDPRATRREGSALAVERLAPGDRLWRFAAYRAPGGVEGAAALALDAALEMVEVALASLESVEADPETVVYNLLLDGNHTYFADDFLVHNKGGDSDSGGGSGSDGGSDSGSGSDSDDDSDDSSGSGSGSSGSDDDSDRSDDDSGRGRDGQRSDDEHEYADRDYVDDEPGRRRGRGRSDDESAGRTAADDGSGRGRGRGRGGSSDDAPSTGTSRGRARHHEDTPVLGRAAAGRAGFGDLTPAGADLSPDEEARAIASGWAEGAQ